jgi:hypothetical protein
MENALTESRLIRACAALFLGSVVLSVMLLDRPEYGGDEVFFATPLIFESPANLRLFQFEYAGPLKTLLTWPLFATFGFSVHSLRLFSLATYVFTCLAWCVYLQRKAMPAAAAATLAFFALNPDLQFFARDDINQPTFNDLVVLVHFLVFLVIVENGPRAASSIALLVLSFVDVNAHIRNVWICNALLLAFLFDHAVVHGLSRSSAIVAVRRGWPVVAGWAVGAATFAHVLVRFGGSPALEGAKSLGDGFTWTLRAKEVAQAIPELIAGGRVLTGGYNEDLDGTVADGIVMLIATALAWALGRGGRGRTDAAQQLLRLSGVILIAIIVQYAFTKSARWPWHGNTVILFWGVVFGLVVQALWTARRRELAFVYSLFVLMVFATNRASLERAIGPSVTRKTGFELAVWNPQGIDAVRDYLRAHPAHYVFSDWAIGRSLALEFRYRPQAGKTTVLYDSGMPDDAVKSVRADQIVLRAVGVAATVPDMTDARMSRLGMEFRPLQTFKDDAGREAYQLGRLVARY